MQLRLTIESVQARMVVVPLSRPVRTAVGAVTEAPLVLIDLRTREGVIGSAYIFCYTRSVLAALARLITDVGSELKGKPALPRDLMRFFDRRYRLLGWQGLVGMTVSGIDMAVWDALGKAAAQPVAELLGSASRPITAYDSYGIIDPARDAAAIAASVERGFKAIKIKLGEEGLDADIAAVRAVREAIGPGIQLMVDYNQALNVAEAVRRIRDLEEFDLAWIEEPVKTEDHAGHALVRQAVSVPIQTGENWWFAADMTASLRAGASSLVMPDLMKIGGVTGWMDAAALAAAYGLPVSSHIFMEASAHVLAATPTAHFIEHLDLASAILARPLQLRDGAIEADGPGLGIEWNEDAVRHYAAAEC